MNKMLKILIILFTIFVIILLIKKIIFSNHNTSIIDNNKIIYSNGIYDCVVFDGEKIIGMTTLEVENGKISNEIIIKEKDNYDGINYFIMPQITDAHTHITSKEEINQMISNGITSVYDVASNNISNKKFEMNTSITTIMPNSSNINNVVYNLIDNGAKYIKVMVDMPKIMGGDLIDKKTLKNIVDIAHSNNLKVAMHTTSVKAIELAVANGADILIHVPIGEEIPTDLASKISKKNISVVPTLVMMKAFSNSPLYGYKKKDYQDALNNVRLLNSLNIPILVGTDSNNSYFVPNISHGASLYEEITLLKEAGLNNMQILQGLTMSIVKAYNNEEKNYNASFVLIEGRPDKNINDITNIRQIWINNEAIFKNTN